MKSLQLFPYLILIFLFSCMTSSTNSEQPAQAMDVQGHRGCRGLLPENTIPAFLKALDIGVTTLELDCVISADSQVVVSHEPFFNHEISRTPEGEDISEETERSHNLFEKTLEEIRQYDVGLRPHPRFPTQEKIAVAKPSLAKVIEEAESYAASNGRPAPFYNIETKTTPAGDNSFHPEPEAFVDLLMGVINEAGITERVFIQSFDVRTLQVMKEKYPGVKLVLLVENEEGLQANLDKLGFVPEVYSPWFKFVDEALVKETHQKGMQLIPWTLNENEEIQRAIDLGVDGIISDYPDRVMALLEAGKGS